MTPASYVMTLSPGTEEYSVTAVGAKMDELKTLEAKLNKRTKK